LPMVIKLGLDGLAMDIPAIALPLRKS